MKVHFIAIGGSAMHNLAIALKNKGYQISGSDDEIFEPSRSRLEQKEILPQKMGWDEENITPDLDAIILGMHAREDNPELKKAKEMGIPIYSYPEYLYNETEGKTRVVIGGSHGKTTITSMILHVLQSIGVDADYMVGAQLEGFDCMVKLTENAKIAILEGDEYLSSPIDRRPKFHLYKPHIALLSGIAWDHINVFPTFQVYLEQFRIFIRKIEEKGKLIYCKEDNDLRHLVDGQPNPGITYIPYGVHRHHIAAGKTVLKTSFGDRELQVFGEHNLQNLSRALEVCRALGVTDKQFYEAIQSFKGASRRLELVAETADSVFYKDFAHSPSKLKATTQALKRQFPHRKLVACMELHTFSSLNRDFLKHYHHAMEAADEAVVYYNPETLKHKKLPFISVKEVQEAFGSSNLRVLTNSEEVVEFLRSKKYVGINLLMMTSGTFDGIDFKKLAAEILH